MINELNYGPKRDTKAMAESIVQPDTSSTEAPDETTTEDTETSVEKTQDRIGDLDAPVETSPSLPRDLPTSTIIWTPSFIVTFSLVLVLGLSAEGILSQGWVNHFYARNWVLLAHVVVVLGCWIVIVVRARSGWSRAGGLFACIWALFAGFDFVLNPRSIDPSSPIIAHLHAAISIALLGSYICLSLDRTPFHHWDARFFQLAFLIGSCAVAFAYFLTPADNQSLSTLESSITLTALVLCVLVWWVRPSCWQAQPGPTFLFGMASAIRLFLTIPNGTDAATNLFLSQVTFLCVLLGAMRILQCQISTPQMD
jgi:hypothetical protein